MLSEEEVYNGCKNFLLKNDFTVVAGQPPRGVDHLPVIEIKEETGLKGSLFSYKPDLIAYKDKLFYIIECKSRFSSSDRAKLNEVLTNNTRKTKLYFELSQYKIMAKVDYNEDCTAFCSSLVGVLAYSGDITEVSELKQLIVKSWQGNATFI